MATGVQPSILITNDDGIHSEGLLALEKALAAVGRVTAVAPTQEMSAASLSISLYRPIRYEAAGPDRYAVHGTPVDSVILALNHILTERPSLVVSGINKGANLGENVFYSGTVGAAVEGTLHRIPSFAISICSRKDFPFEATAQFAAELARFILQDGLPAKVTLNVNVPPGWTNGVRLTRRGSRARLALLEKTDPRDRKYYWIHEHVEEATAAADSDHAAIRDGCISVTPLTFDYTDGLDLPALERWVQSLQSLPAR